MTNFATKIRLIYIPFLIIALCFIVGYSLLNWLAVISFEAPLNEELVNFWLPFGLPWIPLYIWLRPRIKLLTLKDKKGNLPFLYMFIAALVIIVPTIIAQEYLSTATGKLTKLFSVNQITKNPLTKYYKISHYYIDKLHPVIHRRSEVSGKNNEYLDFYIDVACPILSTPIPKEIDTLSRVLSTYKRNLIVINGVIINSDTTKLATTDIERITVLKGAEAEALYGVKAHNGAILITTRTPEEIRAAYFSHHIPVAWLGVEFNKHVSNHESTTEKERDYREFGLAADSEFTTKNLDRFVYLDRIGNNSKHKGYIKAIKSNLSAIDKPIILEAKNEPFEDRNGDKLPWIFKSFGIGAAVWLLMIAIPKLNTIQVKKITEGGNQSEWESFYSSLKNLKVSGDSNFLITIGIISANVLVFLVMVFAGLGFVSFETGDLLAWGADYRPAIITGEWWRLLTSMFLHSGLMHLFGNMYGLLFAGILLEPAIGKYKYTFAYILCGIISSLASIWWHPATVGVGASGAIFGLYGVLLALLVTNRITTIGKKPMLIFCLIFIGFNLLFGLTGGIDNAAHIGGLLSGMALGFIFYFFIEPPKPKRKYTRRKNDNPESAAGDEPGNEASIDVQ